MRVGKEKIQGKREGRKEPSAGLVSQQIDIGYPFA